MMTPLRNTEDQESLKEQFLASEMSDVISQLENFSLPQGLAQSIMGDIKVSHEVKVPLMDRIFGTSEKDITDDYDYSTTDDDLPKYKCPEEYDLPGETKTFFVQMVDILKSDKSIITAAVCSLLAAKYMGVTCTHDDCGDCKSSNNMALVCKINASLCMALLMYRHNPFSSKRKSKMFNKAKEMFTKISIDVDADVVMEEVGVEPQSKLDTQSGLLSSLFAMLLGLSPKGKFLAAVENLLRNGDKYFKNISLALNYAWEKLGLFVKEVLGMDSLGEYFETFCVTEEKVKVFAKRIETFSISIRSGVHTNVKYTDEVFDTFVKEYKILYAQLEPHSYDAKYLTRAINELHSAKDSNKMNFSSLSGERIEPVGVLFRGLPKVFKTILMNRIAKHVTQYTIPLEWEEEFLEDHNGFIYNLPNDQFWEKYSYKAWVAVKDDIFQLRDAAGSTVETEASKIISLINCNPYCLKMADINLKNSMYFRSPFVMATTNLADFNQLESVRAPKAVQRRFHYEIEVLLSDKYNDEDGNFSVDNLPTLDLEFDESTISSTTIPKDVWKLLVKHDGVVEEMTYDELLISIIDTHKEHIKQFYINKAIAKHQTETFDKIMRNRLSKGRNYSTLYTSEIRAKATSHMPGGFVKPQSNLFDESDNDIPFESDSIVPSFKFKERPNYLRQPDSRRELMMNWMNGKYQIRIQLFLMMYAYVCNELQEPSYFQDAIVKLDFMLFNMGGILSTQVMKHMDSEFNQDDVAIQMIKEFMLACFEKGLCPVTGDRIFTFESILAPKVASNVKYVVTLIKNTMIGFAVYHSIFSVILPGVMYLVRKLYEWIKDVIKKIFNIFNPSSIEPETKPQSATANLSEYFKPITVTSFQGLNLDGFKLDKIPRITPLTFGDRCNATDIMSTAHNKYFFILYVLIKKKGIDPQFLRLGHATCVKGQYFMIPAHFIFELDKLKSEGEYEGAQVVFMSTLKHIVYKVVLEDFLAGFVGSSDSMNSDICLVRLPMAQKTCAGIYKHLITDLDVCKLRDVKTFTVSLMGARHQNVEDNHLVVRDLKTLARFSSGSIPVKSNWDSEKPIYALRSTIAYDGSLSQGDCGSLLFYNGNSFENRSIIGFHVAGTHERGYTTVVTKETIDALIPKDIICFDEEVGDEMINFYTTSNVAQSGFQPLGKFDPMVTPLNSGVSDIKKSNFFGKLPFEYSKVNFYPSRLRPFINKEGEQIRPGELAYDNYGKEPGCVAMDVIYKARDDYANSLNWSGCWGISSSTKDVLDVKTALHSFGTVKPINSSTSAGWPMSLTCFENLKKEYFESIQNGDLEKQELVFKRICDEINDILSLYRKGTRPFFVYTDNLKDEKLKRSKVLEGLTRLFSGSPFIMLVLFRMYFGNFMDKYFETKMSNGSAIGVNPFSEEWDNIARKLLEHSSSFDEECIGAGDYSKFDGHEQPIILNCILDIILDFYSGRDEENRIRTFLWAEITNSRHIFLGEYFDWACSMPSGNPMTAIINTMYNNICMRSAFILCGNDIRHFADNVYCIALGDDILYSVHADFRDTFNEMLMTDAMSKIGMVYTTETKTAAVTKFRKITEVEFLKRSFSLDLASNRWVGPRRMESIMAPLDWTKKGLMSHQISVDNMCDSIRELALHDKHVYDKYVPPLRELLCTEYPGYIPNNPCSFKYYRDRSDVMNNEYEFTF